MKKIIAFVASLILLVSMVGCKSDLPPNHSVSVLKGWEIEQDSVVTISATVDSDIIGKELTFNLTNLGDDKYSVKYTPDTTRFSLQIAVESKGNYFPQVMLLNENITDSVSLSYSQQTPINEEKSTYVVPL